MTFAGLSLAQLSAVFAAAAAFATVLYVLKLRRRVVAVPFAPLWDRIVGNKEATSLFSKLKRLLSLLVQLVLLLLLALALGDPRTTASIVHGRSLVVLVDASASMQATDVPPAKDRLGAAKDEVRKIVRGLVGTDRMLLAQMDAVVTPLGPMSSDAAELERALDQVAPTDARADFPRALRFAADVLRGAEGAEIVVVSDGRLGEAVDASGVVRLGDDVKITFLPVGRGARNVGITAFSVRRYPLDKSRYEVMLELTNAGPETEEIELSLLADPPLGAGGSGVGGSLVDVTKLRLRPGERMPRFYPSLSGASRALEARIVVSGESADSLAVDNRAFALLPERKRAKVLVVTSGNTYLEAALLLDEFLDVQVVSPRDYAALNPARMDVILFDGVTPAAPPATHAIYIDPRGPGSPVNVEGELKSPGFDRIDRKHPIVRFTALDDVNIARGHKLIPQLGDKIVGASVDGPLLVTGQRGGKKFAALGFDPKESDLPLRVAWPVLLMNCINFFSDDDAVHISGFRTGEVWRLPTTSTSGKARLRLPTGSETTIPVHEGRAVYLGDRAGIYELSAPEPSSAEPKTLFAANLLDAEESAIDVAKDLVVDGKKAGTFTASTSGVRRDIWMYLVVAAVLLTILEWITYHRRVTV
jgi:hypothetical protein